MWYRLQVWEVKLGREYSSAFKTIHKTEEAEGCVRFPCPCLLNSVGTKF